MSSERKRALPSKAKHQTRPNGLHKNKYSWWHNGLPILFSLFTLSASAAPVSNTASYVVNLAGINVADVSIDFKDDGANYDIDVNANVIGVGTLVAKGSANAGSSGKSNNGRLLSSAFNLRTKSATERFSADVQYNAGNATGFQVEPPLVGHGGRIAIERSHMRKVADPLASFILKADKLSPKLCERSLDIFTGMERYTIDMSFAAEQQATSNRTGYQGPVILCRMKYKPVAGHFVGSEVTQYLAESKKILIWYAPLKDTGYFIPYRVLLGTAAGDLSMVLTKLR